MDEIFGKNNFRNEIVWHYKRWPAKQLNFQRMHDVILFYSKQKNANMFRIEYEDLSAGTKKRWKGKKSKVEYDGTIRLITQMTDESSIGRPADDVWDMQLLNSQSKERTGYPTQKPLALLHRIIKASSNEGDIVFDPFCGCATTCVAAQQLGRKWIGNDIEKQAVGILIERLSDDAGLFKDFVNTAIVPQRTDVQIIEPVKPVKERLYKEQNGLCNGCYTQFEIRNLEIDHIIPKSKGGGDYYENYQLLCSNCNRKKGDRPMEYLRMKSSKKEELLKDKIIFGA
jgi:site-specific DNA-methyltransferase (adenine-specific)